jgi:hypothetical protein
MNGRTEEKGETRRRQFHRPEQRRAPHRRPPSSKEIAPSIPGRNVTESRSHNPLPTARPVRSTPRSVQERPEASGTSGQVTTPVPARPSRSQPSRVQFDIRMAFTLFGFAVAAVLIILFGLDVAVAVPFQRVSPLMDVTYLICGIILAGLSWSCYRDLR